MKNIFRLRDERFWLYLKKLKIKLPYVNSLYNKFNIEIADEITKSLGSLNENYLTNGDSRRPDALFTLAPLS